MTDWVIQLYRPRSPTICKLEARESWRCRSKPKGSPPQRNGKKKSTKMTYTRMLIATLFIIAPKLETSYTSINRRMNNQTAVYLHNGIPLINKKE